jgi:hypothetical protein
MALAGGSQERVARWSLGMVALVAAGCGDDGHVVAHGPKVKPSSGGSAVDDGGTPSRDGGKASGGATGSGGATSSGGATNTDAGKSSPSCTPKGTTETKCSDGADDDCDGYVDCLDSDCEGMTCGTTSGLTCTGGACLGPSNGLPDLPRIDNVRVIQQGDTSIIQFEPIAGALDYRVYPMPKSGDIMTGQNGEVAVKNAVYRCAGDRPFQARADDPAALFTGSLSGAANTINNYERKESEALLGYVYLTPGPGRTPVYRMSNPEGAGGFMNANWVVPLYGEANSSEYALGTAARDKFLAAGFRDDGIAFYAPDDGTRKVYRKEYHGLWNGSLIALYFTDGPEADARAKDDPSIVTDFGQPFQILDSEMPGAVALHRVLYNGTHTFDVLAAGDARYQRVLTQGNQPLWSVTWPALTGPTTLVVEALDQGCPFPGGYVSSTHADADSFNYPSMTLDEARLSTGEVFINGQHETTNRPKPLARAFVDVKPETPPKMDWFDGFDPGATWEPFKIDSGNNGVFIYRNDKYSIDFSGCSPNLTIGPLLGQLAVGYADFGSSCNMSLVPKNVPTTLGPDSFLHARMSVEIPSTGRRYPQLMITTTKVLNPGDVQPLDSVPLHARLGPLPFDKAPPGPERSIIVQPFGGYHELQIQFCDQRGWGVSAQCPQANIYGYHAGDYTDTWDSPWLPVPVMGDVAGYDRPVRFDVYASTKRVYVFIDEAPAGCAVLPDGKMPEGPVNVAFRGVLYHSGIDESVTPDTSGQQYLKRFSLSHFDRHMDDLGIDLSVAAPTWDESRLPCGTRWYGGG